MLWFEVNYYYHEVKRTISKIFHAHRVKSSKSIVCSVSSMGSVQHCTVGWEVNAQVGFFSQHSVQLAGAPQWVLQMCAGLRLGSHVLPSARAQMVLSRSSEDSGLLRTAFHGVLIVLALFILARLWFCWLPTYRRYSFPFFSCAFRFNVQRAFPRQLPSLEK